MDILIKAGANVHSAAMDDMSSLHFAAQQGHLDVCRTLINAGVYFTVHCHRQPLSLLVQASGNPCLRMWYWLRSEDQCKDQEGDECFTLCSEEGSCRPRPVSHTA